MSDDRLEYGGVVVRREAGRYFVEVEGGGACEFSFGQFRTVVRSLGPSVLGTDPRVHARDSDYES